MKNLLFSLLFLSSFSYTNTHEKILTAIIDSNYDDLVAALPFANLSLDQKDHYLELANQMINARQNWMAKHSRYPQVGKDLIIAAASSLVASLGLIMLTGMRATQPIFSTATLANTGVFGTFDGRMIEDLTYRFGSIVENGTSKRLLMGATLTGIGVYFSITKLIAAFQKPQQLLANAVRIQDALYNA